MFPPKQLSLFIHNSLSETSTKWQSSEFCVPECQWMVPRQSSVHHSMRGAALWYFSRSACWWRCVIFSEPQGPTLPFSAICSALSKKQNKSPSLHSFIFTAYSSSVLVDALSIFSVVLPVPLSRWQPVLRTGEPVEDSHLSSTHEKVREKHSGLMGMRIEYIYLEINKSSHRSHKNLWRVWNLESRMLLMPNVSYTRISRCHTHFQLL